MTETAHILIVDDDQELRELLRQRLSEYGFNSAAVGNGDEMFAELSQNHYDLILLDIMLPHEDGLALCRALRAPGTAHVDIPIIFISALGSTTDRIVGLELGGDDYLPKPFQTRELVARIRALLRRFQSAASPAKSQDPQEPAAVAASPPQNKTVFCAFASWKLNIPARHLVDDKGVVVPLSSAEFRLLMLFIEHPQQVLTRDQIMEHITGRGYDVYDRAIDVQISRLRGKLRDSGRQPRLIRTMRGDGYMLAVDVQKIVS